MRRRLGSVESVVLPVPERPQKIAVFSPFMSAFAEQCIEAVSYTHLDVYKRQYKNIVL